MKVMLYAPFCHLVGSKELELKITSETISVREMLKMLTTRWCVLKKYFGDLEESRYITGSFIVIADDAQKELDDLLKSNTTVKILGLVSGG